MELKQRIKIVRQYYDLTQADFAGRLKISKSTVEALEYGRRALTERLAADICRVFGVRPEWLRDGVGDMLAPVSREAQIAQLAAELLKNEEPSYRDALIKLIAQMDTETIKTWYDYARRWVDMVDEDIK